MPKFIVYATVTQDLQAEIEADSLEEAQRLADQDLITGDFEQVTGEFTLGEILEIK